VTIPNLPKHQKRLQQTLNDKNLLLRYNHKHGFCQVWYQAPNSGLYVIMNVEGHFDISQIIHALKERQRTRRQLQEMYATQVEKADKGFEEKNRELAKEAGRLAANARFGRLITSGHTK